MPNKISGFQKGDIFFNCDNSKLKNSPIFYFFSERYRWVEMG